MNNNQKTPLAVLSTHVSALCDTLRDTRAEIEVLTVIPGPAWKMVELRLREQNCLYLLAEARAESVKELEAA